MARSLFAGGSDYRGQPLSELAADLDDIMRYSGALAVQANEVLERCSLDDPTSFTEDTRGDYPTSLMPFVGACALLAESVLELKPRVRRIRKGKAREVDGRRLQELGVKASELNVSIGQSWHRQEDRRFHADEYWSRLYADVRDYFVSMIDLQNIGQAVEMRAQPTEDHVAVRVLRVGLMVLGIPAAIYGAFTAISKLVTLLP